MRTSSEDLSEESKHVSSAFPADVPLHSRANFELAMKSLNRPRLASLMQREQKKFVDERPKSQALFERGKKSLLAGVPMNWMVKWAGAFPPFVREAQGAHFYDVDGHRYIDFCLGDTGAMTGHSPFRHRQSHRRAIEARHHAHASQRRLRLRRRRTAKAFWTRLLAVCFDRYRCQSFFDPPRSPNHRTPQNPRLQLVLPRVRRRDIHHPAPGRHCPGPARKHRSRRRSRR